MDTYSGLDYLKIDVANQAGLDKENFETRLAWFNKHEHNMGSQLKHAEDQIRFVGAFSTYTRTKMGKATGHLVGLDACASGTQVMSAITGCHVGAKNTGLTSQDREDFYDHITVEINNILQTNKVYSKAEVKSAAMPYFYGSRQKPKDVFGEDTPELLAFYKAIQTCAPGAYDLMTILLNSWQPFAEDHSWDLPDGFEVKNLVTYMKDTKIEVDELNHTTFNYRHAVNAGTEEGLANAANVVHSIDGFVNRELCRRCNYNRIQLLTLKALIDEELWTRGDEPDVPAPRLQQMWEKHSFISLVGTEWISHETLKNYSRDYLMDLEPLILDTLNHTPFPVITVHDEFKAHANNMNRVRRVYLEIFAELAESNILNAILTDVTGTEFTLPARDFVLGQAIRNGNYALS